MLNPVGFELAVDATRRLATSALPDAPQFDDRLDARPSRRVRVRLALAHALRTSAARANQAAARVQPYPEESCGTTLPPAYR